MNKFAIQAPCHACAFFHTQEEFYQVLLPFIKEGIECGEKAVHILDQVNHGNHLERLQKIGIDTARSLADGQLEILKFEDAYLRSPQFKPDTMIRLLEDILSAGPKRGFSRTRLIGSVDWAAQDISRGKELIKYEAQVNTLASQYKNDFLICTYDLSKHDARIVVDAMRTHPFIIIGGIIQENPFYVPPEILLEELLDRERRALA